MPAPGRLIITLRTSLPNSAVLPGHIVGNSFAIYAEVRDEAGALVDVAGAQMLFRRPGLAVPLRVPSEDLERQGTGRYLARLVPDTAGPWRARFEVLEPLLAADEIRFVVPASAVITPGPPQPVLADENGALLLAEDGSPITVRRMNRGLPAGALLGRERLPIVQGESFRTISIQELRSDAKAATEEAIAQVQARSIQWDDGALVEFE